MDSNEKAEPTPVKETSTSDECPAPPSAHDDWSVVMGTGGAEKAKLLKDIEIIHANLNYCE